MTFRSMLLATLLALLATFWMLNVLIAQESVEAPAVAEPAEWVAKLQAAVQAGEGLILTAEETGEMFAAIAELERARVADVAVSAGTVYVIGAGGTVVASTPIP